MCVCVCGSQLEACSLVVFFVIHRVNGAQITVFVCFCVIDSLLCCMLLHPRYIYIYIYIYIVNRMMMSEHSTVLHVAAPTLCFTIPLHACEHADPVLTPCCVTLCYVTLLALALGSHASVGDVSSRSLRDCIKRPYHTNLLIT